MFPTNKGQKYFYVNDSDKTEYIVTCFISEKDDESYDSLGDLLNKHPDAKKVKVCNTKMGIHIHALTEQI